MTRITLPNGRSYDAGWAVLSLSTGNLNIMLEGDVDAAGAAADFTGADEIAAMDEEGTERVYRGYTVFLRFRRTKTGAQITLGKEESHG